MCQPLKKFCKGYLEMSVLGFLEMSGFWNFVCLYGYFAILCFLGYN